MGSANHANICRVWTQLLYLKGHATIEEGTKIAAKGWKKLFPGDYDNVRPLRAALEECCKFLIIEDGNEMMRKYVWAGVGNIFNLRIAGLTGLQLIQWGGPYIQPLLSPWALKPKYTKTTIELKEMLDNLDISDTFTTKRAECCVAGDLIEEIGLGTDKARAWAAYVRELPAMEMSYKDWTGTGVSVDNTFLRIPWMLCDRHKSSLELMPILGNVTR